MSSHGSSGRGTQPPTEMQPKALAMKQEIQVAI
jgi:hypothetical protein